MCVRDADLHDWFRPVTKTLKCIGEHGCSWSCWCIQEVLQHFSDLLCHFVSAAAAQTLDRIMAKFF